MADRKTQCAKELTAAAQDEYITDPQGRRVRRWHHLDELDEHGLVQVQGDTPLNMTGYLAWMASEGGRKCTYCGKYRKADDLRDASGCHHFGSAIVCCSGMICGACLEKAKAKAEGSQT